MIEWGGVFQREEAEGTKERREAEVREKGIKLEDQSRSNQSQIRNGVQQI